MPAPSCTGPLRRREFLRLGTLALGGLSLADLLAARAAAGRSDPDTSVILFWMWGGPSQLETYDPKPDAPAEYRGPFRPIRTTVPGMDICELFPLQAKLADKIALVRSLHHTMSSHNDGSIEVLTGKTPARPDPTSTAQSEHPDFGMVASRLRGPAARRPAAVRRHPPAAVHDPADLPRAGPPGVRHRRPVGAGLPPAEPGARRRRRRRAARRPAAACWRSSTACAGTWTAAASRAPTSSGTAAFQMLTNPRVAAAFDLSREDPRLRDRYGRHLWGQSCLLARRLAEAGAAVITIDALAPSRRSGLLQLGRPRQRPARLGPGRGMRHRRPVHGPGAVGPDRGHPRTAAWTARSWSWRSASSAGRRGWRRPAAASAATTGPTPSRRWSAAAGCGWARWSARPTAGASIPSERPLTPQDLLATIYRHLGIDHRHEFRDFTRPADPDPDRGRADPGAGLSGG